LKIVTCALVNAGSIVLWLLSAPAIGGPSEAPTPAPTAIAPPTATPLPEPIEAISLARETVDASETARREIARLADLTPLLGAVEAAKRRETDLRARLREIESITYASARQLSRLHDFGASDVYRLNVLEESVARRIRDLAAVRDSWKSRADFWQSWGAALQQSPEAAQLAPSARVARRRCDSILAMTSAGLPRLLELQRTIVGSRRRGIQFLAQIDETRQAGRDRLLRRSEPLLFSAAFVEDLRTEIARVRFGMPPRSRIDAEFLQQNAGLLFLHLLAMAGIAWVVRLLRREGRSDESWQVLERPWAIGVFGATVAFGGLYRPSPLLWELIIWTILAVSGSRLAGSLFQSRLLRLAIYFTAIVFPLLNLLDWLALPTPVIRLVLFAVAAMGAALLLIRFRRLAGKGGLAALIAASALILALVCLSEIAGFHAFCRWLLQSLMTTGLLAFIVVVLLRLGRGGLRAVRHRTSAGSRPALRLAVLQSAQFAVRLLGVGLIFAGVLATLNIWELIPSPWRSAEILLRAGVTLGSVKLTAWRVLGSILVLYAAVLASVILRAGLREEVLPRRQVDRGVGDAIQTLVHYVVVVIGLALALSVLGIRLQSVAIIVGALGVGIGFGLQNIVNNFVSGLVLLFERPVRVGDTVVIGGEWGTIRSIGLRSTVLSVYDGSEVVVPNGELVSQRVTNWTLTSPRNRIEIKVSVAYGTDVEKVFEVLSAAAAAHPAVLKDPAPQILFAGFGSSSLDFEVRVWLPEVSLRVPTQSDLRRDIDRRFRAAGIEIPFPQQDLHVRSVDLEAVRKIGGSPGEEPVPGEAGAPPPREGPRSD
jgi:potassium-dependent mechanosensitive channel